MFFLCVLGDGWGYFGGMCQGIVVLFYIDLGGKNRGKPEDKNILGLRKLKHIAVKKCFGAFFRYFFSYFSGFPTKI